MVNNAYVFVSDALRYDYLPPSLEELGDAVKTVASSTITPTSFSSICSGLHPPTHGVETFFHQLDPMRNVLELPGYDTSFWELLEDDAIYSVLGQRPGGRKRLEEMEEPFIHIERELSTHAPYAQWNEEYLEERKQEPAGGFFEGFKNDVDGLRAAYRRGTEVAAQRFKSRLTYLERSGLLEDTLVIFTADHGELLGEYGAFSHTLPLVPELIEVPTLILHPEGKTVAGSLLRHVDLLPTIADVLELELSWEPAGVSAYAGSRPRIGFSEYRKPRSSTATTERAPVYRRYRYTVQGVWDADGGWVFNRSGTLDRAKHTPSVVYDYLRPSSPGNAFRLQEGLYHHLRRVRRFGTPELTRGEAEDVATSITELTEDTPEQLDLSEQQMDRLRDLGYV